MLTGDPIDANEAKNIGLVYKVFEHNTLEQESIKFSERLAKMPTKGLGLTKKALNDSINNTLNEQLEIEKNLQTLAAKSNDYNEGVKAFLEKRKPYFKGN